jgi:lysophospholipase L1-like esterase
VITVNKGRGGGTATDVPNWPYDGPAQLAETLANDQPDVVVLAFGTNDLRFSYSVDEVAAAYQDLAAEAEQAGAFVLIALTPPVAPWFPDAGTLNPLYEILNARLSMDWPAGRLVDFATQVEPPGDYLEDGIHFTVAGHAKRALAAHERLLFDN